MNVEIPAQYGYVIAVFLAFWVQQNVIFVIPIAMQRSKTNIKPPTLYPTDSQIKELKLSEDVVNSYMCTQRVHQNNVEFLSCFLPLMLLAGLFNAEHAAIAGAIVWAGRMVTALGYWKSAGARMYGGW